MVEVTKYKPLHRSWLAARSFEFYKAGNAPRKADEPVRYAQRSWRNKLKRLTVLLLDLLNQKFLYVSFISLHKYHLFTPLGTLSLCGAVNEVNRKSEVYIPIAN